MIQKYLIIQNMLIISPNERVVVKRVFHTPPSKRHFPPGRD